VKKHLTLKLLTQVICLSAIALTTYAIVALLQNNHQLQTFTLPDKLRNISYYSRLLGLSIMTLFVAYKGRGSKGAYLLASFWAGYILNNVISGMLVSGSVIRVLVDAGTSAIVAALFIYSLQNFPERVNATGINSTIKNKPLRRYLAWLLKPINLWLYFALVILALYLLMGFTKMHFPVADLVIMITGFLFMAVNYFRSSSKGRNSILWFFWGVLALILSDTFFSLLNVFNVVQSPYIRVFSSFLETFILMTTLFMSIFFADSFDTGVIIKRTLVNGFLFLLIILVYNTAEHYLMHTINEHLEINDAFTSSLLSGVLILAIRPLHHKLEHFLDHKFKSAHPPEQHIAE